MVLKLLEMISPINVLQLRCSVYGKSLSYSFSRIACGPSAGSYHPHPGIARSCWFEPMVSLKTPCTWWAEGYKSSFTLHKALSGVSKEDAKGSDVFINQLMAFTAVSKTIVAAVMNTDPWMTNRPLKGSSCGSSNQSTIRESTGPVDTCRQLCF